MERVRLRCCRFVPAPRHGWDENDFSIENGFRILSAYRFGELALDRPLLLYCRVGQRAYYGTRFLNQHGYHAANLSGGYTTYTALVAGGVIRPPG